MKQPKISVIVPVYNVEKYLRRCVDSILSQTFTDFELLLIDDGSTDASGSICDEYALKDNRVLVFHKDNEGISRTRQYGFDLCSGSYVQFIDSDDWVEKTMLSDMYNKVTFENSDIVACNFYMEQFQGSEPIEITFNNDVEYKRICIQSFWTVLWRHLIRKQFVLDNNINFPLGIDGGEDYQFITTCVMSTSKISCCNKKLYHYNCINTQSFMHMPDYNKLYFQVLATENVIRELSTRGCVSNYTDELLIRKHQIMRPLVKYYPRKSLNIFPEADMEGIKEKWRLRGLRGQIELKVKYLYKIIMQTLK